MLRVIHHLKSTFLIPLTMVFVLFGLSAYGQEKEKEDKTYIRTTETGTTYEIIGWETKVVYNPYTFTWNAWEEPVYKKKKVKEVNLVPLSEFDRPPVFDGICLTMDDKFACSQQKLQEYIDEESIDYPDAAQALGQEGLEYVTFTLDKNGKFKGKLRVVSKEKPCRECADAAVDIVAGMEDMWYPAYKDGKAVVTQLTIPIRFKLLNR